MDTASNMTTRYTGPLATDEKKCQIVQKVRLMHCITVGSLFNSKWHHSVCDCLLVTILFFWLPSARACRQQNFAPTKFSSS